MLESKQIGWTNIFIIILRAIGFLYIKITIMPVLKD
jgi:hypothetical protein